ncbi:hypothetical protein GTG28_07005 [Vibrio sp. OCN044]|uniref:Uncharacterized protein n=1 Tax=Vibrio tetraodonis subsp. pristinus TaxID=2695891 RepID=A0A6L8M0B5_9VIBR|nr:hypothetical protein [Vibrio tetraodonis]MYM58967.1 hypothetical protein [Vibrio tetraodonis subsp. pristinus]MYM58969.1 hypothetical protein [Vibrio tetraodonis subsp. pristinus]
MKRDHPVMVTSKIIAVVCIGPQMLYRSYVELLNGVTTPYDYVYIGFLTHILFVLIKFLWLDKDTNQYD